MISVETRIGDLPTITKPLSRLYRKPSTAGTRVLAQRLGISRTLMVNIEAGRQRAPLHVLWQIAELLETKLILLIPSPEELLAPQNQTVLDKEMMKQIEEVANGYPATIKALTGFVTKKLKGNVNA
jgi:transcriptional regulator with XRE-family HTH domain